ncbi:hypothetical protein QQZ08_009724 [Neonectria magnoliae]|uniref:Uncharacterized protein n=1 Tax=Neonectria magnoliae TaxID=2732573 RepID=A0ABR1HLA8_9HYPO
MGPPSEPPASPTLGSVILDITSRPEKKAQPWKKHHEVFDVSFSLDDSDNPVRLQIEGCPIGLGG